jgi:hypothetical protein
MNGEGAGPKLEAAVMPIGGVLMIRSASELKGYTIEATDGDIGEVVQFYFDDEKWTIRYLVADTGGWLMGRKVLISPAALGRVDWNSRKLHVNMNKERVENSPGIDTDRPVSRQQETDYYNYYGYPYYWSGPVRLGSGPISCLSAGASCGRSRQH